MIRVALGTLNGPKVRGDWLKPGCVVIDVGINAVEDPPQCQAGACSLAA